MSLGLKLSIAMGVSAAALFATPMCHNASMSLYTSPGYTCQINQIEFSNFSYTGTGVFAAGGAYEVPTNKVKVKTDPTSSYIGLNFEANWVFRGANTGDVHISYTATDIWSGQVYQISSGYASSFFLGGSDSASSTCSSPCSAGNFANTTQSLSSPASGPFTIHLDDVLTGTSTLSGAHLSIITSRIFTRSDVPPPPGVPEPGTVLLSIGGIAGLIGARRMRARNA